MGTALNRLFGPLLILAAILGLVFSLFGLVFVWRYKTIVTKSLDSSLDLVSTSLSTTAEGMALTQESLKTLSSSMQSVEGTLQTATQTIEDTRPMMDTVITLLNEDLPGTVQTIQVSLNTAYQTAQVIDSVLNTLSFLSPNAYNPEVPLHTSLANISESLNALPVAFSQMADSLDETNHNFQTIEVDLALVQDAIRQVETSIGQYDQIIADYQVSLKTVEGEIDKLRSRLPVVTSGIAFGLTVFLVWMAIAQIGLLTQGMEMSRRRSDIQPPASAAEKPAPKE
jgi:chromosome segregation ATPase